MPEIPPLPRQDQTPPPRRPRRRTRSRAHTAQTPSPRPAPTAPSAPHDPSPPRTSSAAPTPDTEGGRLVYLETDPGELAVGLHDGAPRSLEFLGRHSRFFTWAENFGAPDCRLPPIDGFDFEPTRQPVLLDVWQADADGDGTAFTTIGNWRQPYKELELDGETYYWSKHLEFLKFLELPARTGQPFELALSSYDGEGRQLLAQHGWTVSEAAAVSDDAEAYRRFIAGSRGEFTVAKDQNVRLRTGWVGDRSPTYLAAGRPVILQDTGFGNVLPTGEGLFAFSTLDDALAAVDTINGD